MSKAAAPHSAPRSQSATVQGTRFHGDHSLGAHVGALDGLRGIAVVAVVLHHLQLRDVGGAYVGVDLFFALSGFLITSSLLQRPGQHLLSFWNRRAWRVGPALAVLLAWYLALSLGDPQRHLRLHFAWVAALQYINIDMANGPPPTTTSPHLGHLWSLAAEIQFYAVWPLVVLCAQRLRSSALVVFSLSAITAAAMTLWRWHLASVGAPWGRLYFGPDARGTALFAGAAVAGLVAMRREQPDNRAFRSLDRAAALVALPCVGVFGWYAWSGGLTWRPGLTWGLSIVAFAGGALVLHANGGRPGPVNRVLSTTWLMTIGRASYSIYLWHVPVIAFVVFRWPTISTLRKALVVLPATFVISAASYVLVERPLTSRERRRQLLEACRGLSPLHKRT